MLCYNFYYECYSPYKKLKDKYVPERSTTDSKNVTICHKRKLSKNSSNETVFNISNVDYEKALTQSGYKSVDLKYAKNTEKKGTIIDVVT